MPLFPKKMQKRFPKQRYVLHGFFLCFFVAYVGYFLYQQTDQRLLEKPSPKIYPSPHLVTTENSDINEEVALVQPSEKPVFNSYRTEASERQMWCEIRDYQDLSSDPVFDNFSQWLDDFKSINCQTPLNCVEHDPRVLANILSKGSTLVRAREKVLSKIIRADPKTAIDLAIPQQTIDLLPLNISTHMEKWESGLVNLHVKHQCFDPTHPGGWIMRHASFSNGKTLRAWTYGKNSKLSITKGLAIWGISLGDDLAVANSPYRLEETNSGDGKIFFAGGDISFNTHLEKEFIVQQFQPSVRRVGGIRQLTYPIIMASGMTVDKVLEQKYEINSSRVTFDQALATAIERNGSLLRIDDANENQLVANLLLKAFEDEELLEGFYEDNITKNSLIWVGATDNEDVNGTRTDLELNVTVQDVDINASEGNWRWINGTDENITYANWKWGATPPSNNTKDFAAMDWNTTGATWVDINETARLPFIIEKNFNLPSQQTDLQGIRKVLVIPARFIDETTSYLSAMGGSNNPLTNELGQNILDELQLDSYEPISREAIDLAMQDVNEFFSRNTDGELDLVPVVSPTVTMPLFRYNISFPPNPTSVNPYDSEGNLSGRIMITDGTTSPTIFGIPEARTILGQDRLETPFAINFCALDAAEALSEDFSMNSFAFAGVGSLTFNSSTFLETSSGSNTPLIFAEPPTVEIIGGDARLDNNASHPRFRPANVEAVTNEAGVVLGFEILEPGAYYDPAQSASIFINGEDFTDQISISIENLLVSYVILSNYSGGAPGLGFIGGPGTHVTLSNGTVPEATIAHEIGHNFGLLHANKYFSRSELVLSDDADQIEYGDPYTVMGTGENIASESDLTIVSKVTLNNIMSVGYSVGDSSSVDVLAVDATSIGSANVEAFMETNADANNTFRIYRSNYGLPPLRLKDKEFEVNLPTETSQRLLDTNGSPYALLFNGTGEEANGTLSYDSGSEIWELNISNTGRGFVEEPTISVLDENNSFIMILDPSWIIEKFGSDFEQTAVLVDKQANWLRGIRITSDTNAVARPFSMLTGEDLTEYYLSYRTDISYDGLTIHVSNTGDEILEPFLLDATPQTPNSFLNGEGALLVGKTYSDYDADVHFTAIRKGGIAPMPFIEVAIHAGSVTRDEAEAPDFNLTASTTFPTVGEYVRMSVDINNSSNYAYSWYLNEEHLIADKYLNNPSIFLNFNEVGYQILRVVVSDMKGGVSSRNIVISVGNKDYTNKSLVTGTVRSRQNPVQGARVVIQKSPVIEHTVSLAGEVFDSFLPSGSNNPAKFLIDGEIAPELHFHRGEIHRFVLDPTMEGVSMSFVAGVENESPKILLNMLSDVRIDLENGNGYIRNPDLNYTFSSSFANYRTQHVGNYLALLEYLQEHQNMTLSTAAIDINSTSANNPETLDLLEYLDDQNLSGFFDFNDTTRSNLITRPYAKALMRESNITKARVGPLEVNEFGGLLAYGGRGYDRNDTPVVEVRRASIWEDYNKSEANATAYVDGVGTISPVISNSFLGNTWESRPNDSIVPEIVVWGSGGIDAQDPDASVEANVTNWRDSGSYMRTISIYNQGKGFEPNSTMAVLHYPLDPFAYWSFDRHESLFEDKNKSRYQPSPGWNSEPDAVNLKHYWRLDTNVSGGSKNEINASAVFSGTQTLREKDFNDWGLLGKALEINSTNELHALRVLDENFTLSMWVKPEGNFDINFSSTDGVVFDATLKEYELSGSGDVMMPQVENYWTHVAIVSKEDQADLYIDGRASPNSVSISASDLNITSITSLLLDEVRIYGVPLSEAEVRYLAGRTYLDLSGNKYHAPPIGSDDFLPISPETVTAGDDKVPEYLPYPNSSNGSGRLGDSFAGELNGLSLQFDGASDYLDLSTNSLEFGLAEGTFSLWVKTTSSQSPNPLFWLSSPPVIDVFTDTDTNETEITITPGSFFALELSNGLPRLGGIGANSPSNQVNDGDWHHIVATFPLGQIWIDGSLVSISNYDLQDTLYEGFDNLFSFSADADTMNIGRAMDRTIRDQEIFFNGRMDDFVIYDRLLTNAEVQYLFEMRRGREQLPRLEAIVDAIGTVDVNRGGAGYRENPELVFWYGSEENKSDLSSFPTLTSLENNFTDTNGTHGQLAYVVDEDTVYSFHKGKSSNRTYSWRQGTANGWRRLIDAHGIGEFENASVGEIVWVEKMNTVTTLPMPDGRMVDRIKVDYITMNQNRSTPLELNASYPWPHSYYQPNGIFGFNEKVTFSIAPPTVHNPDATESPTAEAFSFYFLDQDINESVTILDGGHGINNIPLNQVRINGSGYQPALPNQKEEDHPGYADIDTWDTSRPQNERKPLLEYGFGIYDWNGSEDVNVSVMDFNRTFSSVSVDNPGFGYSMPVSLKVIGGFPQKTNDQWRDIITGDTLQEYNSSTPYSVTEALLEVSSINQETGAITGVNIINPGSGYINYNNLNPEEYPFTEFPMISVSGGGGRGAQIRAVLDENGSIDGYVIWDGGAGYFNWKKDNAPIAKHSKFNALTGEEKNATLDVRLGGYLKEIPRCTLCQQGAPEGHDIASTIAPFSHLEPWIEIWDRGRNETDIDTAGDRAHAAPKVINGKINKVVVTKSGRGYIDPVAYVRDASPKDIRYWDEQSKVFRRTWKCTFPRITEDGKKLECGHIHWGLYPPEYCPGETDAQFPYADENGTVIVATGDQIDAWKTRFNNARENSRNVEDENTTYHLNARFLSRKCWGTKTSYILDDDAHYRNPRSEWLHMDANVSAICEGGKIIEVVVENNGSNYYASQLYVEGSGTGVDAIPVFDEYGLNTSVIFDDPKLKNLELDQINRPKGAGQGFQERPWAWDETENRLYLLERPGNIDATFPNDPKVGYPERLTVVVRHSQDDGTLRSTTWNFGTPVLADYLGDRILSVEVTEPGFYSSTRDLSDVTIDFNGSVAIDQDFNGSGDFVAAEVSGLATSVLTRFVLDDNATFEDNSTGTKIERGLFDESPEAFFLDGRNLVNGRGNILQNFVYDTETRSNFIRLNDVVSYDADSKKSFIELYVDDRFPTQFYYGSSVIDGNNTQTVPALGNRILVSEHVPGGSWATNEPVDKNQSSYTDLNGQYAFGNLDPGLYNVTVFLEDKSHQESTFRPQANPSRISEVLYVPGFPKLLLESDNLGKGKSSLVWSLESRNLARPSQQLDAEDEFIQEFYNKRLQGVGRGFNPSADPPELTFIPGTENLGTATPKIDISIDVDGSLTLTIVDDSDTTSYFPGDEFTVVYSESITGVDFYESFYLSESNRTINSGSGGSQSLGTAQLVLFPDDAGGLNPIEVPLSTSFRGDQPFNLNAVVFDSNGSIVSTPIDWSIRLDFNASDGNNSRVAQFEDENGNRDINASGEQVSLFLYSTLREGVGSIQSIEILSGGSGYQNGDKILFSEGYGFEANVTQTDSDGKIESISLQKRGFEISKNAEVKIWDVNLTNLSTGTGATIQPTFFSGLLTVEANATLGGVDLRSEILIRPSSRNVLSSQEEWLNKYLDSFMAKDGTGWGDTEDNDTDGLSNSQEFLYGTNPLDVDTDLDGLTDRAEVNGTAPSDAATIYNSNPLIYDTDNDGWNDYRERYNDLDSNNIGSDNTTNPRSKDTDGDGLNDPDDLDPRLSSGDGIISGRIFKKSVYGESSVYFRYAKSEDINTTAWSDTWTGQPTSFYISGLTDGNYTVQAFVDTYSPKSGNYTYGEPIAEQNVTLANGINVYGVNLIPIDPDPILYFQDPPTQFPASGVSVVNFTIRDGFYTEQNVTVDANATNAQNLSEFEWGIIGKDPHYAEENNVSSNSQGIFFEISDGNFSEYLEVVDGELTVFEGTTAHFDLGAVPVGKYFLTYSVQDEFGNYAENSITQNIEIRDAEPPEISFLFQGGGVTTLPSGFSESSGLQSSNSSAVLEWDITDFIRFSDQFNEESDILIQLFDLKNHFEDDFSNANQPDWSVTYRRSNDLPDPNSTVQDIEDQNLIYGIPTTTDQSFELDASNSGTYKLEFVVIDQSGNTLDYTLYIILKSGAEIQITAVDGYLSNATVIFDADGDGQSDLNRKFYTDSNGRAKIILSQSELDAFDLNQNGRLDPNEGKFVVIGGIDTSTGTKFSGKLIADANASVVSPLTTMIAKMMDMGATKEEAVTALALALNLDTTIDFTNYDPIQKAFEGDIQATTVMMANLRMANLVNQAEGLLLALSDDYQGYEVGSALLGEIAKGLNAQSSVQLDLENALVDALPTALASVGTAGELSLEDQLTMFQLMADLDQAISLHEDETDFASLMDQQIQIINDLETLFDSIEENEHNVSLRNHHLQVSYQAGGTTLGSGIYPYGSKVVISASAQEGYYFSGWLGEGVVDSNGSSTFVTMTQDRNLTALFSPLLYEISIFSALGGEVTGAGTYPYGEVAQLQAVADPDNEFIGWVVNGEERETENVLQIPVDQDLSVIARFSQISPLLDLTANSGGTVNGSGNYNLGEVVHLQALANDGFVFAGWEGDGVSDATKPSITVTMSENRSLHATFAPQSEGSHSLILASNPVQGGKTDGMGEYPNGATVNIGAFPLVGYTFDRWVGEGVLNPEDSNTSVLLSGNTHLEAQFSPIEFNLLVDSSEGGLGLGGGVYPYGSLVNLTAVPQTGYQFDRWEGVESSQLYTPEFSFRLVDDSSVRAIFEPLSITVELNSSEGGLAYGSGTFDYGTNVEITAVPSTGHRFIGWVGTGLENVDSSALTLSLTEDVSLMANFVKIDNYFTPRATDFSLWIDQINYQPGEPLHYLDGEDGDGDSIYYQLITGNIDADDDGNQLFGLFANGTLSFLDTDEIIKSAGNTVQLIFSLYDGVGKTSQVEGLIRFAPEYVLNSEPLGSNWYESSWLGTYMYTDNKWLYHRRLGWLFVYSLSGGDYWFWDAKSEDWLWTNEAFFPWVFSNSRLGWIYFNLSSEKVRFFNHNLQEWNLRP